MTETESAAYLDRERKKKALAPDFWNTIRELIVAKCSEVNETLAEEHYRCHDELPNKLHVIRLNPVANLHLEFFPDGSRIRYDVGECVGDYLIEIDDSSGQAILSNAYHHVFDLQSTAEHLLEECLEKAPF